ncbi:MAG: hypothetical protein KC656_18075, partial [Myxococcales bacterium]|nr:hypothetical protein [Myxococcales bacterium]
MDLDAASIIGRAYGDGLVGSDQDGPLTATSLDRPGHGFGATLPGGQVLGGDAFSLYDARKAFAVRDDGGFSVAAVKRTRGSRGTFYALSGTCTGGDVAGTSLDAWFDGRLCPDACATDPHLRTIVIDDSYAVPVVVADPADNPGGVDVADIQVANDADNLYVRVSYHTATSLTTFFSLDVDHDPNTGFDVFGLGL